MVLTPPQLARYIENGSLLVRGVSRKESAHNRWINNIVPYAVSPQYTSQQKQIIRSSLRGMEKISCFRFVERKSEKDYVFIVPLDGCYSYVGRIGGGQLMSLSPDCLADFIIWHEMMHAIGFEHEHQRPDRDNHLTVKYENVIPAQMVNFEKIRANEVDYPDKYDYSSLMHYDSYAFGKLDEKRKVRMATMIPKKAGVSLGDNMAFSPTDIRKLNRLGKCPTPISPLNPESGVQKKPLHGGKEDTTVPSAQCFDRTSNCHDFKEAGKCEAPSYKALMENYCALTCGYCKGMEKTTKLVELPKSPQKEHNIKDEVKKPKVVIEAKDGNDVECEDLKISCKFFVEQCQKANFRDVLKKHCRKTCGYC
ncbi:unnamed protein product, partial [Mesorhabditis spiculigera]